MVKQIDYEQSLLLCKVRRANPKKKTAKTKLDVSAPRGALGVMHIITLKALRCTLTSKLFFADFFFSFFRTRAEKERGCLYRRQNTERVFLILYFLLSQTDPNVTATTENKSLSPLHFASWYDTDEAVNTLIDNKSNVECSAVFGQKPLHFAVTRASLELVKVSTVP